MRSKNGEKLSLQAFSGCQEEWNYIPTSVSDSCTQEGLEAVMTTRAYIVRINF